MYTSLSIQDFRGIHTLEMNDFRRVNILTGKNNCGKTSVLEAVYLLSQSDNFDAVAQLGMYRNVKVMSEDYWRSFFYNFGQQTEVTGKYSGVERSIFLHLYRSVGFVDDAFAIEVANPDGIAIKYKREGANFEFVVTGKDGDETKDITASKFYRSDKLNKFLQVVSTLFIHPTYLTDASKRFGNLELGKEENYVTEALQGIEPLINYIKLINGAFYCDIGKDRLLPLNVMGDGMVRLFSIILAIATTPGGVVLVDEIDTGFHYSSLEVMWKAVYAAAEQFDVQIFATTHSYECLRALGGFIEQRGEADDTMCLYRIDKQQEKHDAARFDQQQLKTSLEHFWEVR